MKFLFKNFPVKYTELRLSLTSIIVAHTLKILCSLIGAHSFVIVFIKPATLFFYYET